MSKAVAFSAGLGAGLGVGLYFVHLASKQSELLALALGALMERKLGALDTADPPGSAPDSASAPPGRGGGTG